MKPNRTHRVTAWIALIIAFICHLNEARASHAQSADITYQCLGGNQYQISLSFYRDCAGVAAPNSVSINVASATCGENFNVTLNQLPGTGIDVSPICLNMNSQCSGGTYPGVEEWVYQGVVTLPQACSDWVFSFNLCCRNAAINTIQNPSNENIYVEANLNNLNFPCNNSPSFSNRPIPFVCVGQNYCFNHGAVDVDGDSLVYSLIPPATGPGTSVTYVNPYTAQQPLASNPAATFNPMNGDICMTPTQLEVTVMAVLVEEWRNGVFVGSVMRDIQLRTITCTNNLPYVDGINGTNQYQLTACAGSAVNFNINTFDIDASQNVTLTWNNGITGATFTTTGGPHPVGTFNWTPTSAQAGSTFCFTATVTDDNCPYFGSQTFAFCITVTGFNVMTTSTATNCSASNGTASASVSGGNGPYTYQWLPSGGSNANATGLQAGTYTVNVTDASGCVSSSTTTVGQGPAPGTLATVSSNVSCLGGNNGSATANMNGGQQPYTYLWSNGQTTTTILNLSAGTYSVQVTTNNGCISTATVVITQPPTMLTAAGSTSANVSCNGGNDGIATANVNGGVPPYTYAWNSVPPQNTLSATNLPAGNYTLTVSDNAGCVVTANATVTQPAALSASATSTVPVTCFGNNNGSAVVSASGGTGPYAYSWNTNPPQSTASATNLSAGNYTATITDSEGCITTVNVSVTQPNSLAASIATSTDVSCNGGSDGTATAAASGGTAPYTYAWTSSPQTSATALNLAAGTYFVTVTDANGCGTVTTATIWEPFPVTVAVTGNDTICPGQPALVNASASGGTGQFTYNWSPALGNGSTYTVYPGSTMTYVVSATDANGCTGAPDSVTVDVYAFTPANLTVSGSNGICQGGTATVGAQTTGNTGPLTWNWTNNPNWTGAGPYSDVLNSTTTYQVIVSNSCGVVLTASVTVIVNPLPVVTLDPQVANGCDAVTLAFADTNTSNVNCAYLWNFGDGNTATMPATAHAYTQSGTYNVSVVVTSPFGCTTTANTSVYLVITPSPVAAFTPSVTETSVFEPTIVFTDQSVDATGWLWDFGDGSPVSTQINPIHTYAQKGTYNVRLITTNTGGCADTTELPVEIIPEQTLYVPNAFTPNGDGNNDVFFAYGEEITEFTMLIFDRWGNMIFKSEALEKGWDGRANDGLNPAQEDVYVYRIILKDFEGRRHLQEGHVSLVK